MHRFAVFSFLLASIAASAQGASAAERDKILVLDLQTTGIDVEQVKLIDELLTVEIAKRESFDVLSGADVRRMVELEAEKQAVGCEDTSCLADIAGAMGARYVVYGRIGKLGSRIVLTLNLFDSETAGSVGRSELKPESLDVIPDELPSVVNRLVAELVSAREPKTAAEPAVAAAPAAAAPPSEEPVDTEPSAVASEDAASEGPGVMAIVWPAAFAVTGVALLGGGLAYDLGSPTSDDGVADAFDAIGPALMTVGVGTAVVGFLYNPFAGGSDD